VSADGLAAFRRAVLADVTLQAALLGAPEREAFRGLVVSQARALGWDVEAHDVEDALRVSRQAWNARWI
jgi:hypothetical protein